MDWLNKDWKIYLENGDRVLFHTVIDKRIAKVDSWLLAVFFSLLFSLWIFGFLVALFGNVSVAMWYGCVFFVVLSCVIKFFSGVALNSVHYVLTGKGVYKISGLINKRVKFVPYKRITDAEMTRGIIGHIVDTANIGICTASGNMGGYVRGPGFSLNEIDIRGIKEYKKVRQLILEKIK